MTQPCFRPAVGLADPAAALHASHDPLDSLPHRLQTGRHCQKSPSSLTLGASCQTLNKTDYFHVDLIHICRSVVDDKALILRSLKRDAVNPIIKTKSKTNATIFLEFNGPTEFTLLS